MGWLQEGWSGYTMISGGDVMVLEVWEEQGRQNQIHCIQYEILEEYIQSIMYFFKKLTCLPLGVHGSQTRCSWSEGCCPLSFQMPLTSTFLHNSASIHPLVFSFLCIIFCYFQVKLLLDKSSFTISVTSNLFPVSNCNYDHSQRTLCEHSMHFSGGVLDILRTVIPLTYRVISFLQPHSSPFLLVLVTFPFICWIFFP